MKNNTGLSDVEVQNRIKRYGLNKLPEKPPPSGILIFLSQFKNPLVYILLISSLITYLTGHTSDTFIILFAVLINTMLGFVTEFKANNALHSLKKLLNPQCSVLRNGQIKKIDTEEIVPGDEVILSQGDKVPADGVVLFANRLFVDEALLTGESIPINKNDKDLVFMGTMVVSGKARFFVEQTGANTKMGDIAKEVQEEADDTPLKRDLSRLSRQLAVMVLVLVFFVFITGLIRGIEFTDIFITSVALAVSSIPEGLLVGLTAVLAIGMHKILKNKGLVRRLISAETLGGVTTICLDKTGTLTEGKMRVVSHFGDREAITKQLIVANDLDDPLVVAAYEWAQNMAKKIELKIDEQEVVDSLTFSPTSRYFASLNREKDKTTLYVNGAPEILLSKCKMTDKNRQKILQEIKKQSSRGFRLLGMVNKKFDDSQQKLTKKSIQNLEWVGLLAFSDPVRKGVGHSLEQAQVAGIKLITITGDYPDTAVTVLSSLGIFVSQDEILLGSEIATMSEDELSVKLKSGIKLFARTTPELKLAIVKALKNNNEVVAMMGDGINDAPALKHADVGIVVAESSDVAKDAADLILLNSQFETIILAIREGRGMFNNIRKIALYLLSDAFEEIVAVVGTIVLALPLPVTAGQILWINLVSDGFPHLALTVDPVANSVLGRKPTIDRKIIVGWMKALIATISILGGLISLSLFSYYLKTTDDLILARSIAFFSLGVNSLILVFSVRTLTEPFWKENIFANKWLNVAVVVGFVFQLLPFIVKPLGQLLAVKPIAGGQAFIVISFSIIMFLLVEGMKAIFRKHLNWFNH